MRSKITSVLTVIGAVTILVLAANTAAMAATGKGFLLGKTNKTSKVSTLSRTAPGPALSLKTKKVSDAPLAVNGSGKVTNLNADKIDGIDSSALGTRALVWAYAGSSSASATHTYTIKNLPKGSYLFSYEVFLRPSTYTGAGNLDCYLQRDSLYAGEQGAPGQTIGTAVTGNAVMTLVATADVHLSCSVSSGTSTWEFTQAQPLRITAVPINALTLKGAPQS
ncbi:hypothetical protein ABIE44_001681 [Marmoricola sp. OAE513]|uniref:hypothetical protein n=1 Tax=Marmoricola sp. OAE513 TaxID=2817894 RepID=UPI001AE1A819